MELTKKIWHDENSEPPKNYLWAKGGKLFKNIEGQWKEVSKKESEEGGSDTPATTSDLFTKFLFPTKLLGFLDSTGDWPIDTTDWQHWTINGDIILLEDLEDYIKAKIDASEAQDHLVSLTLLPVFEYDAEYVNAQPSWTDFVFYGSFYNNEYSYGLSSMSDYSYNADVTKDDTHYLVGLNPGD